MGEAKRRGDEEESERDEWADEVVADVLALERAVKRHVFSRRALRGPGDQGDGWDDADDPWEIEEDRVGYLTRLAVLRSIGADVGAVADPVAELADAALEAAEAAPPPPSPPSRPGGPFSLVSDPTKKG